MHIFRPRARPSPPGAVAVVEAAAGGQADQQRPVHAREGHRPGPELVAGALQGRDRAILELMPPADGLRPRLPPAPDNPPDLVLGQLQAEAAAHGLEGTDGALVAAGELGDLADLALVPADVVVGDAVDGGGGDLVRVAPGAVHVQGGLLARQPREDAALDGGVVGGDEVVPGRGDDHAAQAARRRHEQVAVGKSAASLGMDRAQADYMGMLATIMNGLALQDALEKLNVPSRVASAIEVNQVSERYIRKKVEKHLKLKTVYIFVGGTGSPYFTTDTAAALRAAELNAEVILMGKNGVSGVYDKDPKKYQDAIMFNELTHKFVLEQGLEIMDSTAASLCKENKIDLIVFNIEEEGNLKKAVLGKKVGTKVT